MGSDFRLTCCRSTSPRNTLCPTAGCVTTSARIRAFCDDCTCDTHSSSACYPTDHLIVARSLGAILTSPRRATNSYASPDEPFDPSVYDLFQAHDPLAVAHAMFCPSTAQRAQKADAIDDHFEGWHLRTRPFGIETDGALTRGFCVVEWVDVEREEKASQTDDGLILHLL